MNRHLRRIPPVLPVGAVQTYEIQAPLQTHWREATCVEVSCPNYLGGWRTVVDESTDLGQRQAHYIRNDRSRRHVESRQPEGLTEFRFEAGQQCFSQHQTRLDRQEIYLVKPGDWRGATGESRRHTRPEDWVDDFVTHQDKVATMKQRG